VLWPDQVTRAAPPEGQVAYGEVLTVIETACPPGLPPGTSQACGEADIRLTEGTGAGSVVTVELPVGPGAPSISEGDEVVLNYIPASELGPARYSVVDHQRGQEMIFLLALCAAVIVAFGRWRGLTAILGLAVSFGVLLTFVIPGILSGSNPLLIAIVGSAAIMFAVLYLTHGLSARTSTAVLGTLVSLALIGVLGAAFSAAARLTGLDDQTTALVASLGVGIDARGLLLAGMVIGALGVLDDVTVTQTSAVWELRRANPQLGATALFQSAMRIGRDHVASAVNTLVLAYAGASLPLLLLFSLSGRSLGDVATSQDVATEIVRTLVGSIGLVASVPVTTAVAALVASREDAEPGRGGRAGSPRRRAPGRAASRGR
jgi:uncharacterized membrane protein